MDKIDQIIELIRSEMKPSLGCTEPAAIGLAVSNTCRYLENPAKHLKLKLSSNIFKNAYSVKIPNAGKAGVRLAAALGCLLARPDNTMEIFSGVNPGLVEQAEQMAGGGFIELEILPSSAFYIEVTASNQKETVDTLTLDSHDNLVKAVRNGEALVDREQTAQAIGAKAGRFDPKGLSIREILKVCETVPIEKILFLREGVEMNRQVSELGRAGRYGLRVGNRIEDFIQKGYLKEDLVNRIKIAVASACDFRMGGGNAAVMTVLGSGNQGIEAILPVAAAAGWLEVPEETMLRGVMMSVLVTMFIKSYVGRLSAVCGAALSGAGSASAICWMMGGTERQIKGAIQNMFGNLSGMVCDGAKDGCALKLANCAGEAVMSAMLAMDGSIIDGTNGIISSQVEDTIKNVAALSLEGMGEADMKIIDIMLAK